MPYLKPERPEKVSAPSIKASKERGEKLVCLTAYDYPTARIVDEAGIDIILVGDSLGNVVLGYGNTVPVTLEEILVHVKAVRRGVQRALLVADMPYGSFHTGADDTVRAALRLVKEGEAEAVKLEGGQKASQVGAASGQRRDFGDGPHRIDAAVDQSTRRVSRAGQDCGRCASIA